MPTNANEVLKVALARRSVRSYSDDYVSDQVVKDICAAGLAAASGRGIHPVEFVVVRERYVLDRLAKCRDGAARMLEGAAVAIVVIADDSRSDTWVEDASIAMANMMLAAEAAGLGGCWIQGRSRTDAAGRSTQDVVFETLGVPSGYRLEAILSLGVPAEHAPAYEYEELPWGKVHQGKF